MIRRPARLSEPHRFDSVAPARSVTLVLVAAALLAGLFAAVPRAIPAIAVASVLGGAWLSLVLAMTLPSASQRSGAELTRRLGIFRDRVNAVGDDPTRGDLENLLRLAKELGLRNEEITPELAQVHASLDALALRDRLKAGDLPTVAAPEPLAAGDVCHFTCPVRFGRRRADQVGHLLFTGGWLRFRGAVDVSVPWSDVATVERVAGEVVISVQDSHRILRFHCPTLDDALRACVLAEHLAQTAHQSGPDDGTLYHAAV